MHFNKTPHTLRDFSFQCIDQVQAFSDSDRIDKLLITKEAYWSAQLFLWHVCFEEKTGISFEKQN